MLEKSKARAHLAATKNANEIRQIIKAQNLSRNAHVWGFNEEVGSTRKVGNSHPGTAASSYVIESLGEFSIKGTLHPRFVSMNREAGSGGHGMTDGTVRIAVDVVPTLRGMSQILEFPVTVKNGYLQRPGVFYNQGTPYVLSQSALDEVMSLVAFGEDQSADRKNMFSPPRTAQMETRRDYEETKKSYESKNKKEQTEEEKAKERRKQRNKEWDRQTKGRTPHSATLDANIEVDTDFGTYLIPELSRVTILGRYEGEDEDNGPATDYIHISSEYGIEALVEPQYLIDLKYPGTL